MLWGWIAKSGPGIVPDPVFGRFFIFDVPRLPPPQESKLPAPVKSLMELIFDVRKMTAAVVETMCPQLSGSPDLAGLWHEAQPAAAPAVAAA